MSSAASGSADAAPAELARRLERVVRVAALRVPVRSCGRLLKELARGDHLLQIRRVKAVQEDPEAVAAGVAKKDAATRLILFREGVDPSLRQLPDGVRRMIEREEGVEALPELAEVTVPYESLTAVEVLRAVLPDGIEVPSGFETVGHIAHMNLQDDQLAHKAVIGRVILDKNEKLRTVVNKVGSITNEYRVFDMEVIAGDDDMVAEVREHGCRFRFDFSKVYWNSKLQTEHRRVVESVARDEVVCDLMCGVGPFAVPLAVRGCRVFANDLNPESYKWLLENARINRVDRKDLLTCSNEDGRAFFERVHGELQAGLVPRLDRLVMNLPASAIEFLDVLADKPGLGVTVHCYCFAGGDTPEADVLARAERAMRRPVPEPRRVRLVRNVAPSKDMYCLEFRNGGDGVPLPHVEKSRKVGDGSGKREAGAANDGDDDEGPASPAAKRKRVDKQ